MTSSSSPPKPILLFAAHALALALLLGYWPSARDLYPGVFRAAAGAVLGAAGDDLVLRPGVQRGAAAADSFLEGYAGETPDPEWRVTFSTLRMGYWPFAVLAALLFATPMPARRRAVALALGLLWIGAFALVRLVLEMHRAETELAHGGAKAAEEGSVLLYRSASEVLNSNIVVIAAVLLAWVVLANPQRVLRMGGLARLLGVKRGSASH